jgi:hypothetical protein
MLPMNKHGERIHCYTYAMSPTLPAERTARESGRRRRTRWAFLLAASLLLHVLMVTWATGRVAWPGKSGKDEVVMTTELKIVPAPAAQTPPQAPAAARPKPKVRPRPPVKPLPPPAEARPLPASEETIVQSTPVFATDSVLEATADPATENDDAVAKASAGDPLPQAVDTAPVPEPLPAADYRIDPPPSAELNYSVQASKAGQAAYGKGKITWHAAGGTYTVTGEAGALLLTLLTFQSEGEFDSHGIAPVLYAEKRFRRSETNTHFNRERNAISFSASTVSYPRKGGEQDRASIVWQLAGLGRGSREKFLPDAEFHIVVAGSKDADVWHLRVVGEEDIDVDAGKMRAWHVVRAPRPGSYDQKIDIWLAPENEWYPVKIRYTEINGDYLDLSLSSVHPVKAQ